MNHLANKIITIAGMQRSGTSWVAKIFDSHSDTMYFHEPDSISKFANMPLLVDICDAKKYKNNIKSFMYELPEIDSILVRGKTPLFPKSYYSSIYYFLYYFNVVLVKIFSKFRIKIPLFIFVKKTKSSAIRFVWKTIESVGRLGVISEALGKNNHTILIVRHPCGYVSSVIRGEREGRFGIGRKYSEDYGVLELLADTKQGRKYNLTIDYLKSLESIERLAWGWVIFNEKAMDDLQSNENGLVISYDEICEDPIKHIKSLFSFCGLDWDKQTQKFIALSTASSGKNSYFSVVRDPKHAASRWKHELSKAQQEKVLNVVRSSKPGKIFLYD